MTGAGDETMRMQIRIYYEDTDCGGVVYYANYLRYFERGRTEYLRGRGLDLSRLHEGGTVFVVTRAEANYRAPARYGELVALETRLKAMTGATITFVHELRREGDVGAGRPLVVGEVTLACTRAATGRPVPIPDEVRRALA